MILLTHQIKVRSCLGWLPRISGVMRPLFLCAATVLTDIKYLFLLVFLQWYWDSSAHKDKVSLSLIPGRCQGS